MSTETLLCDPVLRHGWDGIFNITICDLKLEVANCDLKFILLPSIPLLGSNPSS